MKQDIRKLLHDLKVKWQQVHRMEERFFNKNREWLDVFVVFTKEEEIAETSTKKDSGRPSSDFSTSSERTKRRRTEGIRSKTNVEELCYATQMNLRAAGQLDAAKVLQDMTVSPSKAQKYRKCVQSISENTFTGDSALSLLIELKFSRSQYQLQRSACLQNNCKVFPSYKKVQEAKHNCYPPKSEMTITENCGEIKLQALLDHTAERILLTQIDVIKSLSPEQVQNMILICKWGCDGSSGQSTYKRKFSDDSGSQSDANVFFTSLVPLQLLSTNEENNKIVIWKNPRPSSPRFCRPIKIKFLHETTEGTVKETDDIKRQESELTTFKTIFDGKCISVVYQLALTMIDGKVCNAITGTLSTQRCYLCGATSKDFNDIDAVLQKTVNVTNLQFGLSTLHAWIRFFECCLHLSYKLDLQKWQSRNEEDKLQVERRKRNIQEGFRVKLGLIVDKPKPGYGSTNDGNTARRFFENSSVSAPITGVDEDLIKRFHTILQTISCGYEINLPKFQQYTLNTARKFVHLYPWYYMPTSVHKLLMHGTEIIDSSILPIGQMSEDAQESCHKYFKRFREDFSRKCSRTKNMEDVLLRMLVSSDPFVSSQRQLPKKKLRSLSSEAIELLIPPKVRNVTSDTIENINIPQSSTDENSDNSTDDDEY
ncbi:uncharacterized protein LOC117609839 [Osmia lignaria lignaria]|uniref:uncharacterized protein LOC117609839 n=1 Tax=Osmia lignaria lignaria TaxID=1437193 RepID=UPI00402BE277